jgi:hypothetical protein
VNLLIVMMVMVMEPFSSLSETPFVPGVLPFAHPSIEGPVALGAVIAGVVLIFQPRNGVVITASIPMFITPMVARLKFRALRADVFLIISEGDTCYKPGCAQR